jgi:hypothetical protein
LLGVPVYRAALVQSLLVGEERRETTPRFARNESSTDLVDTNCVLV